MKVLVLESERGLSGPVEAQLTERGHTVLRCDSAHAADGAACRGLEMGGDCPLDADDVDVAVLSRSGTTLTESEHGALCASRQRIPVVIVGRGSSQPFGPAAWPTAPDASIDDIERTCHQAAGSGMAHEAAVRRDLVTLGLLDRSNLDAVSITVVRSSRRLGLTLRLAEDHPRHDAVVKAAAEALRRYDHTAAVIDVSVVR